MSLAILFISAVSSGIVLNHFIRYLFLLSWFDALKYDDNGRNTSLIIGICLEGVVPLYVLLLTTLASFVKSLTILISHLVFDVTYKF